MPNNTKSAFVVFNNVFKTSLLHFSFPDGDGIRVSNK